MASDNNDLMYANDSFDVILASGTFDEVLVQQNHRCEMEDYSVMWYHGNITRKEAEKLLHEAMEHSPNIDMDGVFLVRDSSLSSLDFSLSFLHETRCYHFFIKHTKTGCYCIEGGPTVHGLEKLITYYIDNAGQLPTRLSKICQGSPPPPTSRKVGVTNLLHRAVLERREDLVAKILHNPHCPDINAKNSNGSTALHDACSLGLDTTVSLLLQKDVKMDMIDVEGNMPLHKACSSNRAAVCLQLITKNYRCVQEKNPYTGVVPLHMAAMHGHYNCIDMLLKAHAALFPRAFNNETPIELAIKYGRNSCLKLLEYTKETKATKGRQNWFHPKLDRQGAENLIKEFDLTNGLFLLRPSKNFEMQQVLSVCNDKSIRHYEIKSKEYRGHTVYFIDDGPFHPSLDAFVQYYHYFEDGLQVKLKNYVSNEIMGVKDIEAPDIYCNLKGQEKSPARVVLQAPSQAKVKPELPPRPSDSPPKTPVSPQPVELTQEPLKVILSKNIRKGKEIGQGEYGSVLKAVLVDKPGLLRKETKTDVAVKTFRSVNNLDDFKQEAQMMQSLKHEYILELIGVCYEPCLMLVEEFLPMGSMLDFLEDHPQKVKVKQELYLWAAQIASGMMYLETKRLVHRDLAARNILLKSLHHVKVSDFGLSRAMGSDKEYYKASKGGRWPIKWYAPESVNFGHFSHASDVWSYGVTLWEMFSYGMAPYENMTGVEVIKLIEDGDRLKQPKQCPNAAYSIMKKCWSAKPNDRPTFTWLNRHFDEEPEYTSAREIMGAAKLGR